MDINSLSDMWFKDLKIRPESIKLLEEFLEEKLHDIGSDFLNMTPKAQAAKAIIDTWD